MRCSKKLRSRSIWSSMLEEKASGSSRSISSRRVRQASASARVTARISYSMAGLAMAALLAPVDAAAIGEGAANLLPDPADLAGHAVADPAAGVGPGLLAQRDHRTERVRSSRPPRQMLLLHDQRRVEHVGGQGREQAGMVGEEVHVDRRLDGARVLQQP